MQPCFQISLGATGVDFFFLSIIMPQSSSVSKRGHQPQEPILWEERGREVAVAEKLCAHGHSDHVGAMVYTLLSQYSCFSFSKDWTSTLRHCSPLGSCCDTNATKNTNNARLFVQGGVLFYVLSLTVVGNLEILWQSVRFFKSQLNRKWKILLCPCVNYNQSMCHW